MPLFSKDRRSLQDVMLGDFANDHVMPCLEIWDVVRMEALSKGMWASVRSRRVLWAGAGDLFSRFQLSPALASRPLSLESRLLVAELRQASVIGTSPVGLDSVEMVEALVSALQKAKERAEAHLEAGGKAAEVFVTCFRFPSLVVPSPTINTDAADAPAAAPADVNEPSEVADPPDETTQMGLVAPAGWLGLYPSEPIALALAPRASPPRPPQAAPVSKATPCLALGASRCSSTTSLSSSDEASSASSSSSSSSVTTASSEVPADVAVRHRSVPRLSRGVEEERKQIWDTLDLRLAWLRDSMLVSVQTRWPPPRGMRPGRRYADRPGVNTELSEAPHHARMEADSTMGVGAISGRGALEAHEGDAAGSGLGSGSRLSVDIQTICPELFLSMRKAQVDVDGGWMKGHGVCSMSHGRAATARSLVQGLPCVVFVRDCVDPPEPAQLSSIVHALQLEVSRLYRSWI